MANLATLKYCTKLPYVNFSVKKSDPVGIRIYYVGSGYELLIYSSDRIRNSVIPCKYNNKLTGLLL